MKFDATTSKLYQQIMEAAVGFLGLDAATATETDVHAALDGKKPLAEQLEIARTEAVADVKKQLDDLKTASTANETAVSGFQKQLDDLKKDIETKDGRITELQKDVATAQATTESLKRQHKTETERLSNELAKSIVGKEMEVEAAGDIHTAGIKDKTKGAEIVVVKSKALQDLTKKPEQ